MRKLRTALSSRPHARSRSLFCLQAAVLVLLAVLTLYVLYLTTFEPEPSPLPLARALAAMESAAAVALSYNASRHAVGGGGAAAAPADSAMCAPPPLPPAPEYQVIEGADVDGQDLGMVSTHNVTLLRLACNALPTCRGFNTNGWLKKAGGPRRASDADFHLKLDQPRSDLDNRNGGDNAAAPTLVVSQPGTLPSNLLAIERAAMFNSDFRIYIYPTTVGAHMKTPADYKYGAEEVFLSLLKQSQVYTTNGDAASLYVVPTRCTAYRYATGSREAGQTMAESTVAAMVEEIVHRWPYWNRTRGADHVYLCAHDMGGSAAAAAGSRELLKNAIGLLNTADYDDPYFIPHKDIALPPNIGDGCPRCVQGGHELQPPADAAASEPRSILAFFSGSLGRGRVRPRVQQLWAHDSDFLIHDGYLASSQYLRGLQTSDYCLFLRGHRAWSPRLMDAVWAGCVPVIISDHYDLPLQGAVDWRKMSVIVAEADLPQLKKILLEHRLQLPEYRAALRAASHHLTWHQPPEPLDAFEMLLLELWRRRHVVRYAIRT